MFSESLASLSLHKHSRHPIQSVNRRLNNAAGTVGSLSAGVSVDTIGVLNLDRGTVSQSVISLVTGGGLVSAVIEQSVSVSSVWPCFMLQH